MISSHPHTAASDDGLGRDLPRSLTLSHRIMLKSYYRCAVQCRRHHHLRTINVWRMRWEEKPDSIVRLILITCSFLALILFSLLVTNFHLLIGSACLCSIMLLYGNNFLTYALLQLACKMRMGIIHENYVKL